MGQSGRSRRLPQPGQLTIKGELLGYLNNNNHAAHEYFKRGNFGGLSFRCFFCG